MVQSHVPHLMPQHAGQFLVRHHIHDAAVHADAAIGTGESIDLVLLVYLEVERELVHAVHAVDNLAQTLGVRTGFRQHLALGIQLLDVLAHIILHLGIRKRKGLGGIHASLDQTSGVQLRHHTARTKAENNGHKA